MFKEWISDLKKLLLNKNMIIAFFLLLVIGFTFGYNFTTILDKESQSKQIDIKNDKQNIENVRKNKEDGSNISVNSINEGKDIIKSNTQIIFEREYIKSEYIDKEIEKPSKDILGMNESEIKNYYHDWNIINFDSEELVLRKVIDSYSPNNYKIGVAKKDNVDYIAVYCFNKEGEEFIDYISQTPISMLSKEEQGKFIRGMIFSDINEVYRMLENYDL
ncbi:hypothetical protein [Garciella nitratireducens]|uniref:BofC C-terminal domain-containing protein n=1 Tax=Garciella nitratireducens DSM 15102 TaxID=1121911 RepID=A0A1T4K1J4_9FIRM|nr:hypothetical protein [Garciella nitratireducens]SJZ36346.1 hypothetical protein SAMN02745973_00285 [Garciella nitratireducens DSM 15102]